MENLQGGTLALDHRYHLETRLGTHGLTTLYAGTRDPFDLAVQIAVYGGLRDAGADPEVVENIQEAARHASGLDGEGLLPVVDFGEIEEGVPFVIEKRPGGPTLADRLETEGVFSPGEVADFVDRIAELLETAQTKGVCHGNLEPIWVVFPEENAPLHEAHLCHFGLGPSMPELVEMPQAILTTDLVGGFPPEAFEVAPRSDDGDVEISADSSDPEAHRTPKADQWGLGALAYRMLVGVHPFFDDPVDASDGILRIKTEDPPSLREMGVEPEIADVVDRALQHSPDDRWASLSEFADQFRSAVEGPDEQIEEDETDSSSQPAPDEDGAVTGVSPRPSPTASRPLPTKEVEPKPSGYLLTAAIVALALTNLGWFFHSMTPADTEESRESSEQTQTDTLPSGFQIRTEPPEAEIIADNEDSQELLGVTPRVISEQRLADTPLRLRLRHPDHHEQYLTIEDTDVGRELLVELIEQPAAGE